MNRLIVEADGGSRGNPGPAGFGALVRHDDQVVAEVAEKIGVATNNVAEYRGLIAGLRAAAEIDPTAQVHVRMDSKLVVEQMSGRWKIKHPELVQLALQARDLVRGFAAVTFEWIPREQNKDADRLANLAMDGKFQPGDQPTVDAASSGGTSSAGLSPAVSSSAPSAARAGSAAPGWRPATGTPTRMVLLRHGQTPLSVDRRFSGLGDPALTELGERQAAAAAQRLTGAGLEVIVTSPLRRARQTAAAVAAVTGLSVEVENGLHEVDFGAWEGKTFGEISRDEPAALEKWLGATDVPPPGGESFQDAAIRVLTARDRVLDRHPDRTILMVSHVTPIKILVAAALQAPLASLFRMHLDLTAISVIDSFSDGPAVLRGYNDAGHLPD